MEKCYENLIDVIKNIFCPNEYALNCNKCSLCHLLDLNNLPSLKVIEPDGSMIKKEQIIELRNQFSRASLYTKESIYIIKEAAKMNKEAANTMLKFLEEPSGNVIGFFLTNQKENVIPTILSRCQIINVVFPSDDEISTEIYNLAQNYIEKIEVEKKYSILYNKEYIKEYEKDVIVKLFKVILNIYKNELEARYTKEKERCQYLQNLANSNLKQKIDLIISVLKKINYNVNIDLLLDDFVLEMEEINHETV